MMKYWITTGMPLQNLWLGYKTLIFSSMPLFSTKQCAIQHPTPRKALRLLITQIGTTLCVGKVLRG